MGYESAQACPVQPFRECRCFSCVPVDAPDTPSKCLAVYAAGEPGDPQVVVVPVSYAPPAATLDLSALPGTRWALDDARARLTCSDFLAPPPPALDGLQAVYSGALAALETFERAAAAEAQRATLGRATAAAGRPDPELRTDARGQGSARGRARVRLQTTSEVAAETRAGEPSGGGGAHAVSTREAAHEEAAPRRGGSQDAGEDAAMQRGPLNLRPRPRKSAGRSAVHVTHMVLEVASGAEPQDLGLLRVAGGAVANGAADSSGPPVRGQHGRST